MYFLYTFLYTIVIFFLLPFEYFKRPKDIRRKWLREKFGYLDLSFYNPPYPPLGKGGMGEVIWVHAVSVGEVMAASALLKRIREKYPSKDIVLSTITDTGLKVAKERVPEGSRVIYLPFDIPFILNAAIRKAMPEILIVIETELWPNMFRVFREKGVPVILLNGRISEKSFRSYKRISLFMKKVLSYVNLFGMQSDKYAERIKSLGVDGARVRNLGNFKFDLKPPSQMPEWTGWMKGPVIVAGSTHEGEEELIVSVYVSLKKDFPDLNIIIAPRHPERFNGVEEMLGARGIPFMMRSALSNRASGSSSPFPLDGEVTSPKLRTFTGAIVLLDTVGELSSVYGVADITIIGKSFKGSGGQNPLEPAFWGKPIICGPHMENFPIIQEFYKEGAAIEVTEDKLYPQLKELLICRDKANEIGSKARELYRKNSGAVEKAMKIIANYLP
jgi:3-deoxy-D-manno-octulosonic-acid transferase